RFPQTQLAKFDRQGIAINAKETTPHDCGQGNRSSESLGHREKKGTAATGRIADLEGKHITGHHWVESRLQEWLNQSLRSGIRATAFAHAAESLDQVKRPALCVEQGRQT